MAKFIRVTNIAQGIDVDTILNIDDIGHISERVNTFAQAWVNGYTVEGEPRYTVRLKGVNEINCYLNKEDDKEFLFADERESGDYKTRFTRKELESNGFGWVFDCEGIEIVEVE